MLPVLTDPINRNPTLIPSLATRGSACRSRSSVLNTHTHRLSQRRGNLGGRMGSCPPNYKIGWAANVFCPPKIFSQHISSRPNYIPVILASVDSISDSRSLCALCSISQLVTSVNYLKNFPLIETKACFSRRTNKLSDVDLQYCIALIGS